MKWFLAFWIFPAFLFAQDSIRYDVDFEFYDGFYLSFEDFRNDNPISFDRVVSPYATDDPLFLETVLENRDISYRDRFGHSRTLSIDDLWGYARGGRPFIGFKGLKYMGILLHDRSKRKNLDHFGQFVVVGQISVFQVSMLTFRHLTTSSWDLNQLLFSMKEGKAFDYNGVEFEKLIKEDAELYEEFVSLDITERKTRMFSFILRFNQRHPLYFPFYE